MELKELKKLLQELEKIEVEIKAINEYSGHYVINNLMSISNFSDEYTTVILDYLNKKKETIENKITEIKEITIEKVVE